MEETTTATPTANGVEASAQPVVEGQQAAAQPPEPQSPAPAPSTEDDTAEWLSKKGFDPSDPEAVMKIAKSYREAEKLAMSATREASELKKSLTPQGLPAQDGQSDPMMQEFIQDYRRDKQISSFKDTHQDWQEHEPTMVNLLEEVVNTPYGAYKRSQLVNSGLLSLDDVYVMAKGSAPANTEAIKSQAQQEVLQTLANTQRAGGSTAHASNSNPQTPSTDPVSEAIRKARG